MNECKKLLSIGKTAEVLGVHIDTLREWDKEGKLVPVKTPGNHRRYKMSDIEAFCGEIKEKTEETGEVRVATYARVSSHEQKAKGDLERQNGRVLAYCVSNFATPMCAFMLVSEKQIDKVIVEHKDRLTRFNFQFLEDFFASHNVKIEWMEEVLGKRYEDELVEDMLTLMSSFSNKIYGKRSAENRKKKKLEKLALAAQAAAPVEATHE